MDNLLMSCSARGLAPRIAGDVRGAPTRAAHILLGIDLAVGSGEGVGLP